MSSLLQLARPELVSLPPYIPGAYEPGFVRLNANESPWKAPGDPTERGLNVYPPPRPHVIARRLAQFYQTSEECVLVTRGTSDAIDVLIRGFFAAGRDRILVCPPTFDMYRLYAGIQGAEVCQVPLLRSDAVERDFEIDVNGIIGVIKDRVKLVFLCSPNNPTGGAIPRENVEAICSEVRGRALIVIDEAYQEFSDRGSLADLQSRYDNVVVLRTLSKCVSLAGVRCGALLGTAELVEFLGKVLPPYTFPTPSIELVMAALATDSMQISRERTELIRSERGRLGSSLAESPLVARVWPSDANFVFLQAKDGAQFVAAARRAGILVRVFPNDPSLDNCVRVTVGRPEDNDRLLDAIATEIASNGR
ncbi:MAG TPA: histidinol-phosphate transaminase [Gammaproteobacteria bacterium]